MPRTPSLLIYCFSRLTRMSPIVSVPEVLPLVATTEIKSPALTGTVSLVSEQTAEAEVESAPMVQVSAVAVGLVLVEL